MKRRRVTLRCTRQYAFSGSPAKPYCSVSSAANSMPSMSCEERRKDCGSKRYRLIPRCLTSLHKLEAVSSSFQETLDIGAVAHGNIDVQAVRSEQLLASIRSKQTCASRVPNNSA